MALTCPYCGHPNFATAKTCRRCRKDLSNLCSECGQPRTPGSSFCTHCGSILDIKIDTEIYKKPLVRNPVPETPGKKADPVVLPVNRVNRTLKKCPECFHKIDEAALFCIYCGYVFDPIPATPPPVVRPEVPVEPEKPATKAPPKPAAKPAAVPPPPKPDDSPRAMKPGPAAASPETGPTSPKPRAAAPRPAPSAKPADAARENASPAPPRPVKTPPIAAQAPNVDDTPTPPPRPRPDFVKPAAETVEQEPEPPKPSPESAPESPEAVAEKEEPKAAEGARFGGRAPLDEQVPEFDPKKNAFLDVELDEVELEGVPGLVPLPVIPEYTALDAVEVGAGRPVIASIETVGVDGGLFPINANGRAIELRPFRIDRYPVTNEMYRRFVEATGIEPPPDWIDGRSIHGTDRYPVTSVTFHQAQAFAKWAGKRLPSALEWEKAATGGSSRRYPWGEDPDPARAHFDADRGCLDHVDAHPEGASPVGCEDLMGNACEWTVDPDRAEPLLKGGCYLDDISVVTVATRLRTSPAEQSPLIGFRCVQDVESA
ncbi:MAG: SUMF1/EgtB/PvdO family nonheme iron enzyme [Deltaproteobacteria bacterium]|nr:SUMF1/EgtB/PvdO family nonheme iron enzyme [Deltaproteobacteria bacterium]